MLIRVIRRENIWSKMDQRKIRKMWNSGDSRRGTSRTRVNTMRGTRQKREVGERKYESGVGFYEGSG